MRESPPPETKSRPAALAIALGVAIAGADANLTDRATAIERAPILAVHVGAQATFVRPADVAVAGTCSIRLEACAVASGAAQRTQGAPTAQNA
jgi:hypothetical protein